MFQRNRKIRTKLGESVPAHSIDNHHRQRVPELPETVPIGRAKAKPRFLFKRLLFRQTPRPRFHFAVVFGRQVLLNEQRRLALEGVYRDSGNATGLSPCCP